jgi:hypothetical protein
MVVGQTPINLVTSNVRATMRNELASSMIGASLEPPATVVRGFGLERGKGVGLELDLVLGLG